MNLFNKNFFYFKIYDWPQPTYVNKTLEELNIGTYLDMHIVSFISYYNFYFDINMLKRLMTL